MKINKILNFWTISVCFFALLFAVAGCSSESSKVDAYIASADEIFLSGDYASAEIEYLNAIKLDNEQSHAFARLGAIYFDQGRPRHAAPYLRRANQLDPDNVEVGYRLALLYLAVGDTEAVKEECLKILDMEPRNRHAPIIFVNAVGNKEAIEETQETLEAFEANAPDNPSYKVALAILHAREERMDDAKQALESALNIDKNASYAHSTLAKIHIAEGNKDKAESALSAAAEGTPIRSPFRLELIKFYLQGYDIEKGRSQLTEILEAEPNLVPGLVLLARLQKADKDDEQTLETVQSIIDLDPAHHDALVMKGSLLVDSEKAEESAEILSDAVKLYPNSYLAHYEYARACVAVGNAQKASESLLQSLRLRPDFKPATALLSTVQLQTGEYSQSIKNINQLLESNPDDPSLKIRLAAGLIGQGNIEEAIKIYEELEVAYPENPRVPYLKGRAYILLDDVPNAVAAFQESLSRNTDFLPPLELLTNYYISEKLFDEAIEKLDSHIQAQPESAPLHALQAKVNLAQGNDESAESSLLKAIELQPDYRNAYAMLVQLYLKNESLDTALVRLEEMLENNPEDISAMMIMGGIFEQQSEWKQARNIYTRILEINPEFVLALNNLAYLYSTAFDDLEQAEELAQKARQAYPNDPAIADTLGWIKYLQGDYEMARFLLKESSEQLPNQPEILYHLGSVVYMMGDEIEARRAFEAAVETEQSFNGKDEISEYLKILNLESSDPSNLKILKKRIAENSKDPIALTKLAKIYETTGKNDLALQSYDKVLVNNANNIPALIGKAGLLAKFGEIDQTMELIRKVHMLRPNDSSVAAEIGNIAFVAGDHAFSARLLQEAMNSLDKDTQLVYYFAQALFAIGRVDSAQNLLKQLDEENAKSLSAFLDEIAQTTLSGTDFKEAAAFAYASENKLAIEWVEALLAKRESEAKGIAAFEELLDEFPEFTPAKKELSVSYAMVGENDEDAYKLATATYRTFPDDPELNLALGILEFKRQNNSQALNYLKAGNASSTPVAIVQFYWGMALNQSGEAEQGINFLKRALELGLSGSQAEEAKALIDQTAQ